MATANRRAAVKPAQTKPKTKPIEEVKEVVEIEEPNPTEEIKEEVFDTDVVRGCTLEETTSPLSPLLDNLKPGVVGIGCQLIKAQVSIQNNVTAQRGLKVLFELLNESGCKTMSGKHIDNNSNALLWLLEGIGQIAEGETDEQQK